MRWGKITDDLSRLKAKRIAIIKPSALGDIVHALPTVEAIRQKFPDAHLSWVVNQSFAPLLKNQPAIDEVICFDRGSMRKGLRPAVRYAFEFAKSLRRKRFDVVIDLQGLLRSGLMARFTSAPIRIGFANSREGSTHCYTHLIPAPGLREIHAVERNWLVAKALGMDHLEKRFRLTLDPDAMRWVDNQLQAFPRPWVILGVGARWLTKRWSPEHFASLTKRIQQQYQGTAIFVGTPDERPLADAVEKSLTHRTWNVVGGTTLAQLAAILSRGDLMIGNDTGPLHLATALGCRVVAPYTCTRVHLHGPFGQLLHSHATQVHCAGSYLKQCDRMICMDELIPERLWPSVQEVLTSWANHSRSA